MENNFFVYDINENNEINEQNKNNDKKNEPKKPMIKMQDFFANFNSNKSNNNFNFDNENIPQRNNTYDYIKTNNLQRKNNLLNYKNPLRNADVYIEPIGLFIDDNELRLSEIIFQNYEVKFFFDNEVTLEFMYKAHFTAKYFEFPIFYFFKGSYNEETKTTIITLKDYRSYKIQSQNNQILKRLTNFANNTSELHTYAKNYKKIQENQNIKYLKDGWQLYDPYCEFLRQELDFSESKFCFSKKNIDYKLCETYPNILVIPTIFDNEEIFKIAGSRMKNRFPVLTFFYKAKKSYLYRSAQIKTGGIFFKTKNLEIEYINKIMNFDNNKKQFIIFDCRPILNAKANSLKGAGVEDTKDYENCKGIIFGCIENIHKVRQSLKSALLKAYYGKETIVKGKISFNINNLNMKNFLSKFEETKWLEYLSDLILGSITVSNCLKKGINVLVHCSDGWDRTTQICSLAQIILDPYFRKIEGFCVLIEKEWLSFGHQFAYRNGCGFTKGKNKERSPIFIQFIHAVYQMTLQYPTSFEFNANLLLFLCKEIYSNKYGTFLFNCQKDLIYYNGKENTVSIWSDILLEKNKYINDNYKELNGSINIKGELQYLSIWNDYFFQYDKLGRVSENQIVYDKGEYVSNVINEKSKSIMELLKIIKENGLEDKIKDNKFYNLYKKEL